MERNLRSVSRQWKSKHDMEVHQARVAVFSYFLDQLLAQVEVAGTKLILSFNVQVVERLSDVKMPGAVRGKIRARLFGKSIPLQDIDLDEANMRIVFQIMYEELCDLMGPVKTDAITKATLSLTKQLPEAALYSPQRLMELKPLFALAKSGPLIFV